MRIWHQKTKKPSKISTNNGKSSNRNSRIFTQKQLKKVLEQIKVNRKMIGTVVTVVMTLESVITKLNSTKGYSLMT